MSKGERWRRSKLGMTIKNFITSDNAKQIRDKGLNLLGEDKEHIKRFAQYLTGGTVGNKPITDLPQGVRDDVIASHRMGDYPNRKKKYLTIKGLNAKVEAAKKVGDKDLVNSLLYGKAGVVLNPAYNPKDTLLSTYSTASKYNLGGKLKGGTPRTSGSIGHAQFKKGKDGDYTLTDVWDVDEASSFKNDPYFEDKKSQLTYKPWKSKTHPDLREGGPLAARAYDLAKFLGTNKNLEYNVKFKGSNVDKKKKKK